MGGTAANVVSCTIGVPISDLRGIVASTQEKHLTSRMIGEKSTPKQEATTNSTCENELTTGQEMEVLPSPQS